MGFLEFHISDQDLLRAADGELAPRTVAQIQKHLTECWTCRARSKELELAITDFVVVTRQTSSSQLPPPDGARALLKARMEQLSTNSPSARWQTLFSGVIAQRQSKPAWALIAIAAVVMVLLLSSKHPSSSGTAFEEAHAIPDHALTPGATIPVTRQQVCQTGGIRTVAMVSKPVARQVFAAYGISNPPPRAYELDYLITPALGGDDSIRNFWPQPYGTTVWNAHLKDALEDHLHGLVCDGDLDLAAAQRDIARNWIEAYKKYFGTSHPLPEHTTYLKDAPWE